ncbi:hypothetical protein TI39_contig4251g00011 [Zymoseptoria brevis]|uniref:Uncharacterized protein n=1 Tax=Zymoseptoria brevis TaxID=1047168 RepID=A0A0F4G902_9PEZI|nr:hypothetical protein TI39_contig4251g00011 [Zymoseptoria brevis]
MSAGADGDTARTGSRFFTVHIVLPANASDTTVGPHSLSRSLTVKCKPHDSIDDIWNRSVRRFKRAYGIECPPGLYWSRLQTNEGGDLLMGDTVGELYRPDAPQIELQLRFVLDHINDENPLPPDSALRPAGFRKREWSELTREEQRQAGKLHRWTAVNDPTPASSSSAPETSTDVAAQLDADGFKIPGRPAKSPRKDRKGSVASAVPPTARNSQATVLVNDSQPARHHPPSPIPEPSPSQVSSNSTPPSAQQPPDSQSSQLPIPFALATTNKDDFAMMDDDSILDDDLLGIESSQEPSTQATASSPRHPVATNSHRSSLASSFHRTSSSRTARAGSSRKTTSGCSHTLTEGKGRAKDTLQQSVLNMNRSPHNYVGKGKRPMTSANNARASVGSTSTGVNYTTVEVFARMQQSQSGGRLTTTCKRKPDQKWTPAQEQKVLDGVRRGWKYEQIRISLLPDVHRSASSIRSKMKALREKIDNGTLSLKASSPLASAPAPSSQDRHPWTPSDIDKLRKGLSDGMQPSEIQKQLFPYRSEESVIKKVRKQSGRTGAHSASRSSLLTLSQSGSQPTSSAPGRGLQQSSPAAAASTRRGAEVEKADYDDEELSSGDEQEAMIIDDASGQDTNDLDNNVAALADEEELASDDEDQEMIDDDFENSMNVVDEKPAIAGNDDREVIDDNNLTIKTQADDEKEAPVDDEGQDVTTDSSRVESEDIVFDQYDMDLDIGAVDLPDDVDGQRHDSRNELLASDVASEATAAAAPIHASGRCAHAVIARGAETTRASSTKSAKRPEAFGFTVDAPAKRMAYVALHPRPDMSDVLDMRQRSAESTDRGHEIGDPSPKIERADQDSPAIKAEPVEDYEDGEDDVIDIIREDSKPTDDLDDKSSSSPLHGEKRVFTSIPELETFTNRPSRDFVGVARIVPDFTASLTVADIRNGRNADGTVFTTIRPPYEKDEILRPFHVKKSKLWQDALTETGRDPAKSLEKYREAVTDNAMFKASTDKDNPRIDAIKKLRRWRSRAKAREEGHDVNDAQTLSGQSDNGSVDSREDCSDGDGDGDDATQQGVELVEGGGYAETVASSDEEVSDVVAGGIGAKKHAKQDAETAPERPAKNTNRTGLSAARLRAAEAVDAPASRYEAPQPEKASLKRKASTLSTMSEGSQAHALPSPQSMPMSPIKDKAGVPIPKEELSRSRVRRNRQKRHKSNAQSDAQLVLDGGVESLPVAGRGEGASSEAHYASRAKQPQAKSKSTTEQRKEKRRFSKKEKKRQKKQEEKQEKSTSIAQSAPTSINEADARSSNGQNEEEKSMLDIVRGAQHVPAPKLARQQPRPGAAQPCRFFGDSEDEEESDRGSD